MDHLDWHMARAALQWQAELGVSDAVGDVPIDRYEVPAQSPKQPAAAVPRAGVPQSALTAVDPVAVAEAAAAAAGDLPALQLALQNFSHCDLRRGARNFVANYRMFNPPVVTKSMGSQANSRRARCERFEPNERNQCQIVKSICRS